MNSHAKGIQILLRGCLETSNSTEIEFSRKLSHFFILIENKCFCVSLMSCFCITSAVVTVVALEWCTYVSII